MSLNNPLANALSKIMSYERIARGECFIKPVSKVIKRVLDVLNENKYVGDYEEFEDGRGGFIKLNLLGRINKIGVISPNFNVKKNNFEKYEKRFLPAKDFGVLIVSTPKGIMTHTVAKKKGLGGKLLAYCY